MRVEETPLASALLAAAGFGLDPKEESAQLEAVLEGMWREGHDRWPAIPLAPETFVVHLAAHLPSGDGDNDGEAHRPLDGLERIMAADLYLACACARGIAPALAAFERVHLTQIPSILGYMHQSAAFVEDVGQMVRERLLVSNDGPPRIAEYSGRGALASWVKVVVTRMALDILRAVRELPDDDAVAQQALPAPDDDPELAAMRRHYQPDFRRAVRDAFAMLSRERRHLLHLQYIEQLTTAEIGALFQVSQATASRWLQAARRAVRDETRRLLEERIGIRPEELSSLIRVIDSDLDLGISQILQSR